MYFWKWNLLVCLLVVLLLLSTCAMFTAITVVSSDAVNTMTLNPIACKSVSNIGVPIDLVVSYSRGGNEWITYIAFNLSGIPKWFSINRAVFKMRAKSVVESSEISACCSSDARWIESDMTWSTKPVLTKYLGEHNVTTAEEEYSWDYSSMQVYGCTLADEVARARDETGRFTIQLRSGMLGYMGQTVIRISLFGETIFYPDAKLEITYTISDTSPPAISDISMTPKTPTSIDEIDFIARVSDDTSGVNQVYLYHSINNGSSWNKASMALGEGTYKITLPKQTGGTTIQYFFEASDMAGNKAQSGTSTFTVADPSTLEFYLIMAFIASVIVATLLAFARHQKKARSKEARSKSVEQSLKTDQVELYG